MKVRFEIHNEIHNDAFSLDDLLMNDVYLNEK